MEMLQLRYFIESAKNGSFSKTAKKYRVPTSSVSASIRRLEQELGQKLFSRTSNRVTLNENGARLQVVAEAALSELDQVANDIANPPDSRVVRLLVLSNRHQISNFIIEYRAKHPNISFDICIDNHEMNYGDYDIIVGTSDLSFPEYARFTLREYRIYLQTADTNPLVGKTLTLAQLREQPFVTMGGNMHDTIVSACQRAGFTPNVIAKINDSMCYNKFLRTGEVIGHRRDTHNRPATGMAYLNVLDFKEYQNICVFYKKDANTGSIKNFLEFLKTKAE